MSDDFLMALLGIIGTLLGTILGWILNNISQSGKLKIYLLEWKDRFQKQDSLGGFVESNSIEETEYYHYELSLDLYNSSRDIKIMRQVHLEFLDKKKVLFEDIPLDDSTRVYSRPVVHYDDISVVNIPGKSAINIQLHGGLYGGKANKNENWDLLWNTNKIVLVYVDEKNKSNKVVLQTKDFGKAFIESV